MQFGFFKAKYNFNHKKRLLETTKTPFLNFFSKIWPRCKNVMISIHFCY